MNTKSIGVVGAGFVGGAVAKGFEFLTEVKTYDINPERCSHTFLETVNCDFVFICLPTPMISVEGGSANLSIMEGFFKEVAPIAKGNTSIYVIKSTVPIGTTARLSQEYGIKRLVHNPEFLREVSSVQDYFNPSRNIIGGSDKDSVERLNFLLRNRFPDVPCFTMGSNESESVKYVANAFLATKVIFFNEMYLLAEKLELDWDSVINGVISDERIGKSHYDVPGPDGDFGYGKSCFPKDVNSLIATMEQNGIEPLLLKAGWEQNKRIRKNWDWATNPSAVSPQTKKDEKNEKH